MRPKNDIIGKTFGNLKVIKDDGARAVTGDVLWLLNCSCGEECRATSSDLKRGRRGFCLKCKDAISTKSPLKTLYGSYRRGAIARGLSFNISIEQMHDIIVKNCHYCGTPPMQWLKKKQAKKGITYNGIDRRDSSIGYELSNCYPCCKFCNYAKMSFPLQEFEQWMNRLVKYRTTKGDI